MPGMSDAGFLFRTRRAGSRRMRYVLYVPWETDPAAELPLVLFLHGAGECGTCGVRHLSQGLPPAILQNPRAWPCLVVAPQKPTPARQWEAYADEVFGILEDVRAARGVDGGRIAVTGLSQGGHGAFEFAAMRPEVFSAAAPVCGYGDPDRYAQRLDGVPVWAFHGEADDVVPVEATRAIVAALRGAGRRVRATWYPGVGHDSWTPAYRNEELAAWLLGQRRAGAGR